MKPFELTYLGAQPFYSSLHRQVRKRLRRICRSHPNQAEILDVGGRKSHYTIGLPARITITELPRETELQETLHLGINDEIIAQIKRRRSNVQQVIFDDMTSSALPDDSFDVIVAIEVLEHVEEDALFIEQVHRVLKPGGVFLMTTPNGDFVRNTNPDHKRHYRRQQLLALLTATFAKADVQYAVAGGAWYQHGLKSWSPRRPARTLLSMTGNFINGFTSNRPSLARQAHGTQHLLAVARKRS